MQRFVKTPSEWRYAVGERLKNAIQLTPLFLASYLWSTSASGISPERALQMVFT